MEELYNPQLSRHGKERKKMFKLLKML